MTDRIEEFDHELADGDELTLEQIDRIIANHVNGVQLTSVHLYRQLAAVTRERDTLRDSMSRMREQYERANESGWNSIVCVRSLEDADDIANETLAALEAGELRKP